MDHADGGIAGACAEYDDDVGRFTVIRVNVSCVYTRSSGVNTYRTGCLQQATTRPPCPHRPRYRLLGLDHVTIDDDDLFLVERLLSYLVVS